MAVTSPSPPPPPTGGYEPRRGPAAPSQRRLWVAGAVILAALGFLLVRGLGNATVYFKTVDEAVAERPALGDRRFRLEGDVVAGSVRQSAGAVEFLVRGRTGATVEVAHRGDPPELFRPGIPVVLEGRWQGERYASDRILVKHTSEYKAEHPERVDNYVGKGAGGDRGAPPGNSGDE